MKFDELVEQFIHFKTNEITESKAIIEKMRALAKQEDDEKLYARLAYYEGEALYYQGKMELAYEHIEMHCLPNLKKKKFVKELSLSYNLLGIIKHTQGEYLSAIELFIQGMDVSLYNNEFGLYGNILNNISNIYDEYEDYDQVIRFLHQSIEAYEKDGKDEHKKMVVNINLALTYCHKGHFENAELYYHKMLQALNDVEDFQYKIILYILEALIARTKEDVILCESAVLKIIEEGKKGKINVDNYKEVIFVVTYTSFFLEERITLELFDILNQLGLEFDNIYLEIYLYEAMIFYYMQSNQDEKVDALTFRYFELSMTRNYRAKRLMIDSINTKFEAYRLAKDNLEVRENMIRLKVESELDPLTKLLNRNAIESVVTSWFEVCKRERMPIGVEIIDVDFFKQFNDTYGHLVGDACLCSIAGVMNRMQGENILFIRYGGDEFLAFFFNQCEEKVLSLAKLLKSEIRALNIEHTCTLLEEKIVSITQGLHYDIPKGNENIYDFIRKCDDSLYQGKATRSSIIFNERQI